MSLDLIVRPMVIKPTKPVVQVRCGHQQYQIIDFARQYMRGNEDLLDNPAKVEHLISRMPGIEPEVTPDVLRAYIRDVLVPMLEIENAEQADKDRQFLREFKHGSYSKYRNNASRLGPIRNRFLTPWRVALMNWAVREKSKGMSVPQMRHLLDLPNCRNEPEFVVKNKLRKLTKTSTLSRLMESLYKITIDRKRQKEIHEANQHILNAARHCDRVPLTLIEYFSTVDDDKGTGESAPLSKEQRKNALKLLDQWE